MEGFFVRNDGTVFFPVSISCRSSAGGCPLALFAPYTFDNALSASIHSDSHHFQADLTIALFISDCV